MVLSYFLNTLDPLLFDNFSYIVNLDFKHYSPEEPNEVGIMFFLWAEMNLLFGGKD